MRWDRNSVREGMFVTSTKGERIGKVIRRDDETFVVEKGTLFPKDYELRYDQIAGVDGGAITYSLGEATPREERVARPEAETRAARPEVMEARSQTASLASDVPSATASPPASGLRSVAGRAPAAPAPVNRAPAAAAPAVKPPAANAPAIRESSDDNEMRIPLMQEELEIEKVPRESGHVRIHKGVKTEERHFTVPVQRRESSSST